MPKLEQGDLESVEKLKEKNIPQLARLARGLRDPDAGSVVHAHVQAGAAAPVPPRRGREGGARRDVRSFRVPVMARRRDGLLKTEFPRPLGKVAYHVPCHSRVQKIGPEDQGGARIGAGDRGDRDRALLGTRGHVGREEGVPRHRAEDRPARCSARSPSSRPISSPPTASSPRTTSRKGSAPWRRPTLLNSNTLSPF